MKFFVTKGQIKYWQHIKYIEGIAQGTTRANQAIADQLDTMSAQLRIHGVMIPRATNPIERER